MPEVPAPWRRPRSDRPNRVKICRAVTSPSGVLLNQPMVARECSCDIVVDSQLAIGEHGAAVAILPYRVGIVRHEDDVGTQHALAKGVGAFAPKPLVADLGHLVDQIDVKVDRETSRE